MIKASFFPYQLEFKKPSGTSRGILTHKKIWIVKIWNEENPEIFGIGECNPLVGLSIDDRNDFEDKLKNICEHINDFINAELYEFPSIRFAIETAYKDLQNGGKRILFDNAFSRGEKGIVINGLVWMGSKQEMFEQIEDKIKRGFKCIKLKIGAIDFKIELSLIKSIRDQYSEKDIEIRVDANGAFSTNEALQKLEKLSHYKLHSIEQPIQQGQTEAMHDLCKKTPLPIALDEELIIHQQHKAKEKLLDEINPQYIILKPSLLGGWKACEEWIEAAEKLNIGWWITSALESNIGLNAIAQWTAGFNTTTSQGLGTGALYTNNFISPLQTEGQILTYNRNEHSTIGYWT
ncbi:MAG: o-succinylbenzoate synthase [Flavobacteriales bacterium]